MWKVKRMNIARLIVLGVAILAGGLAALLAGNLGQPEQSPQPRIVPMETVGVLVAKNNINIGHALTEGDLEWQTWPASAAGSSLIRQSDRPDAISQLAGWVSRAPVAAGEPLRESKLINVKGSGYLAAILPPGMRAVSTEISPETGAGGFILPNDYVDVILSRRDRETEKASGEGHMSETILTGVRVLAIDQLVEEKDGQRVVVGKTATLELTLRQAETLARARQIGTISLALRSLADSDPNKRASGDEEQPNRFNMVRFGVTSTATAK
jgi:pilus assembly protein CpaB